MGLPLELVNGVLNHCQPNELFKVALTNSSYRSEAERLLYGSIVLRLHSRAAKAEFKMISCLSTLAKIQSKADMVKSFELIYIGSKQFPCTALYQLRNSLLAMKSLRHLKLNFPWSGQEDIASFMLPAFKQCTFSLITLYIPSMLLDDWLLNQNKLAVLEMHDTTWDPGVKLQDRQISICKQLAMQNSSPITVFHVAPFGLLINRIIAFPIFSISARWSAKDIVDSLFRAKAYEIDYFKLVLGSLSEEGIVHDVLTSLAEHFLYLNSITFFINDPQIHLRPYLFSSLLQKFSHLESIDFEYYGGLDKLTPAPFQANYLGLAGLWATSCPKLCEITFPDGRKAHRDENGHWV